MGSSSDSVTICRKQSGMDTEEQMGCLLRPQLPDTLLVTLLFTRPLAVVPPSESRRCFLSDAYVNISNSCLSKEFYDRRHPVNLSLNNLFAE